MNKNIIIGITGASRTIYVVKLIEVLMKHEVAVHLVISEMGSKVFAHEMQIQLSDIETYSKKIITSKKRSTKNMIIHSPIDSIAGRIIEQIGIEHVSYNRWDGEAMGEDR